MCVCVCVCVCPFESLHVCYFMCASLARCTSIEINVECRNISQIALHKNQSHID